MDQSSIDGGEDEFRFSENPSLEELRCRLAEFARQRDWQPYHTPRNLLLALVAEVGELSELFQWRSESAPGSSPGHWTPAERRHLEHELSDVFIYLLQLANSCRVDLPAAAVAKMAVNAEKYPIGGGGRGDGGRGGSGDGVQSGTAAAAVAATVDVDVSVRETPDGQEGSF